MFDALHSAVQRYWLLGLLVLWAIFLFGGFVFGPTEANRRMPTWTRMASSATLVIAALSWYVFSRGSTASGYALFIAFGMSLGFLGDLLLAGVLPGGRNVIAGILAFGAGHVFYIVAFLRFSNEAGLTDPLKRWAALAIWLLIGLVGWYLIVFRGSSPTLVHWIALPYALLLATTAGIATGIAWQDGRFVPLAAGAALFLLSDLILAGEMFSGLSFPLIGDVIWLTYGPAQMLIVYSVGSVMATLSR